MKKPFIIIALSLTAAHAFAHARLASSTPAANTSVKASDLNGGRIDLHFVETLEPAFSGAMLQDSAGKPIPAPSSVGGKTITLIAPPLKPGIYRVSWHSVGSDTHRLTGNFTFKVLP